MKRTFIILTTIFILLILPGNVLANMPNIQNIIWQDDYNIKFSEVENATSYKYNFTVNSNKKPNILFTINDLKCENGIISFFPKEALEYYKSNTPAVYTVWIAALDENNYEITNLTQSTGGKILVFSQLNTPKNVTLFNGIGKWDKVNNSNIYEINLYEENNQEPLFHFSTDSNNFDFSKYLEINKKYYFEIWATNKHSIYIESNKTKSNISMLELYDITTSSNNGFIKVYHDNKEIEKAQTGKELKLEVTPNDSYINDSIKIHDVNNSSNRVEISTQNTFIMPAFDILITASFIKKAEIPAITFEATGYDCGILINDSNSEITYSIDNQNTWETSSDQMIYLENLSPLTNISAYIPKNNQTTFVDSDLKILEIKRALKPQNIIAISPTSSSNNTGKLIGINSLMQYKLISNTVWLECKESNIIENLIPGTYEIREKASNNILASETLVLEIEKYKEPTKSNASNTKFQILVTQNEGGKIHPETQTIKKGKSCDFTITPDEGYIIKNVFIDGEKQDILSNYTFDNIQSNHSIIAIFEKIDEEQNQTNSSISNEENWKNPFEDVLENTWYYNSVKFSNQNNLLSGITDTKFGPKSPMTRGMLAYVLYKHSEDNSNIDSSIIFSDVKESTYYYKAIAWMCKNNISAGMGKNMFKPNDPITREQLITMLYNYSIYLGKDAKSTVIDFSSFEDANEIHAWAKVPLCWALKNNLISGRTKSILAPREATTRAEFATILMKFLNS